MSTIQYPREQLMALLATPGEPLIPELIDTVSSPNMHANSVPSHLLFEQGADLLSDIENIPPLTYTLYRNVQRFTDRIPFQQAQFNRRKRMSLVAMKVVFGDDTYLNLLHDYMWATCEETNWMLPQVDHLGIELRVPATALGLAEIISALPDKIEDKVQTRIRQEIEDRVFTPYLRHPNGYHWYKGTNNWNGVINGSIGCAFLLLEKDTERLARALEIVLTGLDAFLKTAFEPDGASGEGTGYWMYGLSNFICFSEMLRARTRGEIDLLATDRVKQIAQYPVSVMLSPGHYYAYSDCHEQVGLEPGLVTRLIERTGVESLRNTLAEPANLSMGLSRFHTAWRNTLWWDGTRPNTAPLQDHWLKDSNVVRLITQTNGTSITLAAKAGHNGVPHNHNDIGSFALHINGQSLLCDPESGLYDLYRRHGHDQNLFANSIGHSVPKIGNTPQSKGAEFGGKITSCETSSEKKKVTMEIAGAYEVPELKGLQRTLTVYNNELIIEDQITFSNTGQHIEEAFVTWSDPIIDQSTATIIGEHHDVVLTIEAPAETKWEVESFDEDSEANKKKGVLKRLTFSVTAQTTIETKVRARIVSK